MVQSNADRQKEYRARKRNAQPEQNVTRVTDEPLRNAPVTQVIALDGLGDTVVAPIQAHSTLDMIEARDRRTNPDLINWGPWLNADQLEAHRVANSLPKYHNRSPIPGDWDYVGVAV